MQEFKCPDGGVSRAEGQRDAVSIDPELTDSFASPTAAEVIKTRLYETLPWLGTIIGGVYAVLYARFASQWAYLSGVYDQIKSAECTAGDRR